MPPWVHGLKSVALGFSLVWIREIEDNVGRVCGCARSSVLVPHTWRWNSYRDRLYNGSLGFQTVQSSLGGVLTSPVIPLGKTGINLSYQAGAQNINAETDRQDLLTGTKIIAPH